MLAFVRLSVFKCQCSDWSSTLLIPQTLTYLKRSLLSIRYLIGAVHVVDIETSGIDALGRRNRGTNGLPPAFVIILRRSSGIDLQIKWPLQRCRYLLTLEISPRHPERIIVHKYRSDCNLQVAAPKVNRFIPVNGIPGRHLRQPEQYWHIGSVHDASSLSFSRSKHNPTRPLSRLITGVALPRANDQNWKTK